MITISTFNLLTNNPPESSWYALYTKSQCEKKVESELIKKGIETFTPVVKLKKKWSDRIKVIEKPLFKSYCFAKFPIENRLKVLKVNGLVHIVKFHDQYSIVPSSVINSLRILIEQNINLDPYPYFKKGVRVVIKKGNFAGIEGFIIEKREKSSTIVISVDAISASVKCVLNIDSVDLA